MAKRGLIPAPGQSGGSLFISGVHFRFNKAKFDRAAKSYDGKVGQFATNVATDITQIAKELAPVRFEPDGIIDGHGPGRLRDGISTKSKRNNNGDVGFEIKSAAPYSSFVHDGIGQPPQPFLRDAVEIVRARYGLR